ncbi:NUDIX domain-containing protein [Actinoalloteichus hymeniacidonis]|uniref:NUDIX domain-containing protein n=1 Tax=Actinoalloteichus hymeniacidonis TaxID=340345 RepID=UPI00182B216A|nr:NUDIX domain-containing protein [Actinoalloteichus hymeniacidonis]MBB5910269.1 8-oxo-dGTP diphosphatase [Actinoalloteichus hymeniacidonis]
MPLLRTSALIEAEPSTVVAALRLRLDSSDAPAATEATPDSAARIETMGTGQLLGVGDRVVYGIPFGRTRIPVRTRLTSVDSGELRATAVAGSPWRLDHRITVTETRAGTLLTESLRWYWFGGLLDEILGALFIRRIVLRMFAAREASIRAAVQRLRAAPAVVGAALVRAETVLAAQRARPETLAGRWELPGGAVETAETEQNALVRECVEELGAQVRVGPRIGPDLPLPDGRVLRIYLAMLDPASDEPQAREHRELRWLSAEQLDEVDWLPADLDLLPDLRWFLTASAENSANQRR